MFAVMLEEVDLAEHMAMSLSSDIVLGRQAFVVGGISPRCQHMLTHTAYMVANLPTETEVGDRARADGAFSFRFLVDIM